MRLELSKWGDDTVRLAYWDSLHGDDVILVLNEDGTVQRETFDDRGNLERTETVDLVEYLRLWAMSETT